MPEFTPDAYSERCPSRPIITRLAKKWTMLALVALQEGPKRFGALRRQLEGVSQKTLTKALRGLEEDGLISREVFDESIQRVQYRLTPLGEDLAPLIAHIKSWAEQNMDAILAAQASGRADD